jgi:5-methylcytosine-specific restriction endonuclease McrA
VFIKKYGVKSYKDLTGIRFGKLVVTKFSGTEKYSKGIRPMFKCKCDCGGVVTVPSNSLTSGHRTTCDKEISEANRQKAINTNRKKLIKRNKEIKAGLISPNPRRRESKSKSTRFSTDIRYKYNNTCQKCQTFFEDKYLCAHHMKQFARNTEVRYLKANGILLCRKCHGEFHKLYGFDKFKYDDTAKFLGWKTVSD